MITAVGGTFNVLHSGHKRLLDRAFKDSDHVLIGITSDRMASDKGKHVPYEVRAEAVKNYVTVFSVSFEIFEIDDMYGPAATRRDIDALAVSEETYGNGAKINEERMRNGLSPLSVLVVGMFNDDNGKKVCASNILSGDCSRSGKKAVISISVGSDNPVKVEAVRTVMERIFGEVRVSSMKVDSGVPEQPFGDETCLGAMNRAKAAMNTHDLSVGIEAGVFEMYDGLYDIQHCAILDSNGKMTIGMSSGFRYPDDVSDLVRKGMTVGSAMKTTYKEHSGKKGGAVGILSKGILKRKELTEQSVTAAMIPRLHEMVKE
jgi:inosine/xanthosine triphosphatase